jgi:hypothetical protein
METIEKICKHCWDTFKITEEEILLLEKLSPKIWWELFLIDIPKICPECRQRIRLAFRNERKFYNEKCSHCWKKEISTISTEMREKIVCQQCWFKENLEKYDEEYDGDFSACLFRLFKKVPYRSRLIANMENSEYCNQETDDRDCYLNTGWHFNENSLYNTFSLYGKYTVDNYWVFQSENIYECINVFESSSVFFSEFIEKSFNIFFSYDLKWCQNVIFWYGKKNKSYIYKNEILTKEKWEEKNKIIREKMKSYKWLQEILKEYAEFIKSFPKKNFYNINCENILWNENKNIKNGVFCNSWEEGENIMHWNIFAWVSNSMDIESSGWGEKMYNIASSMKLNNCIVWSHCFWGELRDSYYSYFINGGNNLFWCFGLENKSYFILNKGYTKEEYEKFSIQIIKSLSSPQPSHEGEGAKEWWEFFDISFSPFPYNDTVAMEYFPIKKLIYLEEKTKKIIKEEIFDENWKWIVYILDGKKFISEAFLDLWWTEKINIFWRTREQEINIPEWIEVIYAKNIPDNINDISEDILKKAVICEKTNRPFRIVKMELDFYKKYSLPLPRIHPDQRHLARIQKKSWRKIFERKCDKCGKAIQTTYKENELVYCESCYEGEFE